MPDLVPVRVRDCACPDTPHAEGDIVYLAPKPSLDLGVAAIQAVQDLSPDTNAITRAWFRLFVTHARGANFMDPYDPAPLLDDFEIGSKVAEKANELYAEILLRPLGLTPSKPSPGGPTGRSTSATTRSRRR